MILLESRQPSSMIQDPSLLPNQPLQRGIDQNDTFLVVKLVSK